MEILGTLENLAEVGVAITGFAGIVAAVAYSASGSWSDTDRLSFRALVRWSLGATFLAYLPVVFMSFGDLVPAPWRISNAVFASFHGYIFFEAFRSLREHPETVTLRTRVVLAMGAVVFAAEIAAAAGPLAFVAPSVYLIAVLWFLFIAALQFLVLVEQHFGSSGA